MISRRNIIKLAAILLIIGIGVVYWYYAEKRSSPLEEAQKIIEQTYSQQVPMSNDLVATALEVPVAMQKGVFAKPRTVNLPAGWHAKLFATGLGAARFMAFYRDQLYVTSKDRGEVIALTLPDEKGYPIGGAPQTVMAGLKNPNGITLAQANDAGDSMLLVAATDQLHAFDTTSHGPPPGVIESPFLLLPKAGIHNTRTPLAKFDSSANRFNYYVSVGSTCNVCKDDPEHGVVLRADPFAKDGDKKLVAYATGLRNSVGMVYRPGTSEIWATDNGRDLLGDNLPPDEVNVIEEGKDYGWPYCYGNKITDPAFNDVERCKNTVPPKIEIQAHSAPLGLRFYEKKGDSAVSRGLDGQLLIAYHGSWNRTIPTGYKVVRAKEVNGKWELHDFMTGFIEGSAVLGRPVDVIEGSNGELYVSDDKSGSIYVLTHD